METKIYKQIKQLGLFVVFALWGISNMHAQEIYPPNLWAALTYPNGTATAYYPIYIVYGLSGGSFSSPVSGDLAVPESLTIVNGAGSNIVDGITGFGFDGPYTVTNIDLDMMSAANRAGITSISLPNTLTTIASVANCTNMTSITIPSSVTAISGTAFYNDSSLLAITIPATVTSMGSAFHNCTSLEKAIILNNTISGYQFQNCTALKDVTISDNVTSIGSGAFDNCPSVETLTVPATLTNIAAGAFSGLTGLKNLNFYSSRAYGNNFNGLPIENLDLTGVVFIDQSAFQDDSSLVSITIPSSVTSMGQSVFKNCVALQSANILNSIINNNQFQNCTALKDVTFSNNLTTINTNAFLNCPNVETLTIPSSVTNVSSGAFSGMSGLKTLNIYMSNVPGYVFDVLPIENLDLTGVVNLAAASFNSCTKLKNVVLSNSLQSIGASAFQDDSSLVSITIPSSVTSMGQLVFKSCTVLQSVTVGWQTPLSVPSDIFSGVNTSSATLYVPAGTYALYKAAPVWKDFGNIVELAAPITPALSISPDSLNFAATGGEQTFTITSNTDWTVDNTSSWLTVSPASGSNDTTVVVTAAANTATTQRTAILTVNGTGVDPVTISITQDAAPNLDSIAVNAAKALIEAASYTVLQDTANTEETVKAWLVEQINALQGMSDTGITVTENDVTLDSFTPAVTNVSDGSFAFTVSLSKGSSQTTASKSGTIIQDLTFNITGVPTTVTVGVSFVLSGFYNSDSYISWSLKDVGTTGATIFSTAVSYVYLNGILTPITSFGFNTTAPGTLIVTAAVCGAGSTKAIYTQDFTINVVAAPTYNLNIAAFTGGSVTSDKTVYEEGETVTLNVTPDDGYQLDSIFVYKTDDQATVVALDGTDNTRTFPMPAFDVTVMANFKEIPSIVPVDSTAVGDDGNGTINLSLSVPSGATVTGSFEITFPEGMTLNEELTVLSVELSGNFSLAFTYEGNNTWLIEIKSNPLRRSTATEYQNIMNIAYTVSDTVPKGTYDATIKNLDFLLSDNTPIKEDLLTVPINVERVATSINPIGNSSFYASFINSTLRIESTQTETITIYSTAGIRLYSVKKDTGIIEIPFSSIPGSVYIITGNKSGTIKVVR